MEQVNLGINMKQEIEEIKNSLFQTITSFKASSINNLPHNLNEFKNICIVGCGTSYHSGLIGKQIIENYLNIPCETIIANEFEINSKILNKKTLFIFVSQSGKTTDVLNALNKVQLLKSKTLAITNTPSSPLHNACNYSILLSAGEEKAIASTKAFNCQILAFLMFAINFSTHKPIKALEKLENTINKINFANHKPKNLPEVSKAISNHNIVYFLGKNQNYIFAQEGALKLKETCYIHTVAMPTLEILHGTLASFTDKNFVVVFVSPNDNIEQVNKVLSEIKQCNSPIAIFSPLNKKLFKNNYDYFVQTPKLSPELSHILEIIPFQWLAYLTSISLGNNPDSPRRLVKAVI